MKQLQYFLKDRKATWLELFFDLIFVVVISNITHMLAHTHHGHLDWNYIIKFPLVFIPVWWLWANHTVYSNLYDTDSRNHRIVTLVIMLLMVGLSVFIDVDFDRIFYGFITVYSLIRLIIAVLYMMSQKKHENDDRHAKMLGLVYLINTILGFSAVFIDHDIRYGIVYLSIFLDLFLPPLLGRKMEHAKIHSEHLVERSGLLIIILLGESVISLSNTLQGIAWNAFNIFASVTGFILIGGIWWILFDFIYLLTENKNIKKAYLIIFPNLLLYMGLAVIANLIRHAILNDLEIGTFRFLAIVGVIIFFLGKQIPYYILFPKIRKYIFLNTGIVFILTVVSCLLPRAEWILASITGTLFVYIFSTFRYMIDEDIAKRHIEGNVSGFKMLFLKK
ncbi:low temperature requirement protein A [Carboxylicivirga sp. RSCT41]|uniref:low temperature requirement protein A n=1 Tax=Carboxylicivirga agarovorans TaxID=3417570 RepID=UPI003D327038